MERHEIEVFLTLAEELHFGRTAERLGLSQGRVSQTVKKLERRFGTLLFERTSRRVALTPAGQQFRDDLLPAHRQIQRAVARITAAGRGVTGTLRVGYSSPMASAVVQRAAATFLAGRPDSRVEIQEVQLSDPLGPLRAGELDLQLTELPIDEPDIITGPVIITRPRWLAVPAGHPLGRRESVSVEDYADTVLIPVAGAVPRYWLEYQYPTTTPAGRSITHGPSFTYWLEALNQVGAGKGVTPLNGHAVAYFARPDIEFVPFHDAPPLEYALMWPAVGDSVRLHAFVQAAYDAAAMGDGGGSEAVSFEGGPPP